MKLVLSESQYSRIFNNKKRKLIITESQYKKLLNESSSNMLLSMEKGDTLQLIDKSNNKLHFKVMVKSGNEIIMINCNDGVYKNAYFYINATSLKGGNLSYQIAQNNKIPKGSNPWETLKTKTDIWRKSTFKDIKGFDVFNGGSEGLTCNLDKSAKKKFSLNIETGEVTKPEDNSEVKGDDVDPKGKLLTAVNYVKAFTKNYYYEIELVEVESKNKGKNNEREFVIRDRGGLKVQVLSKTSKKIDLELTDVYGESGNAYKDLVGKVITINYTDKNVIDVNEGIKELVFDLKAYSFGKDKDGNRIEEDEMISGITKIERKGKVGDEDNDEDEEVGLSKDEIKKAVEEDDILKKMIQNNPGDALVFLGLSRKKGIIPSEEIFSKWGAQPNNRSDFSNIKPDNIIKFEFIGKPKLNKDEDKALLDEFISKVKNLDDKLIAKVGRYSGGEYLKLKCKKLSDINYELRLYKKETTGESTFEVVIVLLSERGTNKKKLAKSEIKILDYDV